MSYAAELLRRFTRRGHTSIARVKAHGDAVRQQARDDGVRGSEMGELLTFPDSQTRIRMGVIYDLDHPDTDIRKAGIKRFRKSPFFELFSPHHKKVQINGR